MNHSSLIFFYTSIFIVLTIPEVFSIKCWVCRSDVDPKCKDPFDNSSFPITDCRQEPDLPHLPGVRPTMCRKIRQKVNGEWRYYRSCAYLGEPGTYNIFMEFCTCNSKDGCNTASVKPVNFTLIYLSVFTCLFVVLRIYSIR
ncbi:conserved hypothetical protein [Pediculus humanus corporis]|uniref:Uncharacterized protein n=1 Tax=Pediculus humanus subsp. corporis TaxID=121224 RepID=E0VVY8_PEDHC|nr:uncharacterized protein Phum_PHUM471780 [Pediculus humanus corporis]EEB17544.1 conserved hypothetical protein [Pediculus humanus corporis]